MATLRTLTACPRDSGSRFFASPPRARLTSRSRQTSRPEKRVAGRKTAPGIFLRTTPETRPANLPQVTETHQENSVFVCTIALGCAVDPNSELGQSNANTGNNSNNRPELAAIANDKTVKAAIDAAWNASNPNTPGQRKEHGFWILRNNGDGTYTVQQFPSNTATNDSMIPGPMPNLPGQTTVVFFHTHPNTVADGYEQGPSPADIRFANNPRINIPGIIQAHDGMHYFGPALPPVPQPPQPAIPGTP